jgi:hypothetical protein
MTEATVKPVRTSRWRRLRLFVLLGILLLLVAYTGTDLWAGRQLDAELARLEPRYGNLRLRTIIAPPVPAAENRARLVRAAAALAKPGSTDAVVKGLTSFGNSSDTDLVPADLRVFVEENRDAIRLVEKIGTRAKTSWDVDYSGGNTLPYLDVRNLSNILYLDAMLELEAKRPDEAVRKIGVGLAVASSLNNEPQLIAQLIRMSIADRHFSAVQRIIMHAEPSKGALEDLARWLKEDRPDPSRIGLEAELAYVSTTMMQMEAGRNDGPLGNQLPGSRLLLRIGRPLVRLAHVRYLRVMDQLLTMQAGPRPLPEFPAWSPAPWAFIDRFVTGSIAGLARTIQTSDEYLGTLGACEIAVALRRYRLDYGSYPDDLSALTPAYLDQLPMNPVTGKPPTYARDGAGFTLSATRSGAQAAKRRPLPTWKVPK